MDKVTIGIPRALLYYKYKDLWITFFEELGCDVVVSCCTNKEILEKGKKYINDEACLAMKIFMGHVDYLKDKCDYVLVPRYACLVKHEKLCTNFSCLYDLVRNTIDVKIINYNIDIAKKEDEFYAFTGMGLALGFKYMDVVKAFRKAKKFEAVQNNKRLLRQKDILGKSDKIKILLAGHPYNMHDNLICKSIISFLEANGVQIIYSDLYDKKYLKSEVSRITKRNYWTYNKEIIGAISHYKKRMDGIILLTVFPCGPDSLSNEMIIRSVNDTPIIQLVIDELNSEAGIITRLESFIDILNERRKVHE